MISSPGPLLKTMNFKLRQWALSDLHSLVQHANNDKVAQYLRDTFPHPYTHEDGQKYIQSVFQENPVQTFAIDVSGQAVGSIGIYPQSDIHRKNAEIGYWLSEQYWGQGIMVKAIREIVDYGFSTFDIIRIFARPFSVNTQSQKALIKAGFQKDATFPKAIFKNKIFFDETYFSVYRPG